MSARRVLKKTRRKRYDACDELVEEGGFEPPKRNATDLQSAPFGHSGTPPNIKLCGAGGRIRTPDLLITNQLLYRLSYTSIFVRCPTASNIVTGKCVFVKGDLFHFLKIFSLSSFPAPAYGRSRGTGAREPKPLL